MADGCIVVTGAAGGLGAKTVARLAEMGRTVLAVDLDGPALEALVGSISGDSVVAHVADLTEEQQVRGMIDRAVEVGGVLSALFNNAATMGPVGPIAEGDLDVFENVMRVNVRSVWLGMKHAIPKMTATGGGAIVNTASTGGMVGWPGLSPYCASKHAVVGISRVAALECAQSGVRVNVLAPGPMDTKMVWELADHMTSGGRDEARAAIAQTIPVRRLGEPDEVASVAAWLLTDAPAYLTGAVLPVDGGQTAGPA